MLGCIYTDNIINILLTMSTKIISKNIKQKQATIVRQNFQEVIDQVHYTKEPLLITKHNKPWVIIQALDDNRDEFK